MTMLMCITTCLNVPGRLSYRGFEPYGQFYNNKVEYYGMGVSPGF